MILRNALFIFKYARNIVPPLIESESRNKKIEDCKVVHVMQQSFCPSYSKSFMGEVAASNRIFLIDIRGKCQHAWKELCPFHVVFIALEGKHDS